MSRKFEAVYCQQPNIGVIDLMTCRFCQYFVSENSEEMECNYYDTLHDGDEYIYSNDMPSLERRVIDQADLILRDKLRSLDMQKEPSFERRVIDQADLILRDKLRSLDMQKEEVQQ